MANTKKAAEKAAEVATEVKAAAKETAAKTKAAAKTTAAKTKAVAKDTAAKAKKTATKAAAKTKAAVEKATEKDVVFVEFGGKQLDVAALVEAAKADYKAKGHRAPKAVKLYIKPEEGVAYYTVNDKGDDDQKVEL